MGCQAQIVRIVALSVITYLLALQRVHGLLLLRDVCFLTWLISINRLVYVCLGLFPDRRYNLCMSDSSARDTVPCTYTKTHSVSTFVILVYMPRGVCVCVCVCENSEITKI